MNSLTRHRGCIPSEHDPCLNEHHADSDDVVEDSIQNLGDFPEDDEHARNKHEMLEHDESSHMRGIRDGILGDADQRRVGDIVLDDDAEILWIPLGFRRRYRGWNRDLTHVRDDLHRHVDNGGSHFFLLLLLLLVHTRIKTSCGQMIPISNERLALYRSLDGISVERRTDHVSVPTTVPSSAPPPPPRDPVYRIGNQIVKRYEWAAVHIRNHQRRGPFTWTRNTVEKQDPVMYARNVKTIRAKAKCNVVTAIWNTRQRGFLNMDDAKILRNQKFERINPRRQTLSYEAMGIMERVLALVRVAYLPSPNGNIFAVADIDDKNLQLKLETIVVERRRFRDMTVTENEEITNGGNLNGTLDLKTCYMDVPSMEGIRMFRRRPFRGEMVFDTDDGIQWLRFPFDVFQNGMHQLLGMRLLETISTPLLVDCKATFTGPAEFERWMIAYHVPDNKGTMLLTVFDPAVTRAWCTSDKVKFSPKHVVECTPGKPLPKGFESMPLMVQEAKYVVRWDNSYSPWVNARAIVITRSQFLEKASNYDTTFPTGGEDLDTDRVKYRANWAARQFFVFFDEYCVSFCKKRGMSTRRVRGSFS